MGNLCSRLLGGTGRGPVGTVEQQAEWHRGKANELGNRQRELSARSQAAYKAGDGQRAKELSLQAKALHTQVELHNKEAARLHFEAHNFNQPNGTIDLHGLFVKEALQKLEAAVATAKREKRRELIVIVGAGNHSKDGIQRIRPAVEKWCRDRQHTFTEVNHGCLRVYLRDKRSLCIIM